MDCRICGEEAEIGDIKHLDLFIIGSEGVDVCFNCEMKIVEFIRALKSVSGGSYIRGRKHEKRGRKEA